MTGYAVDLLYDHTPVLDETQLLRRLQAGGQWAVTVRAGRKPGSLAFRFSGFARNGASALIGDTTSAPQILIAVTDKALAYDKVRPAIQQAWDWPDAAATVSGHGGALLITDFQAERLAYRSRLALMHHCVGAVLDVTSCLAIHWQPSQHLVPPAQYLAARKSNKDALASALHVRHFAGQNPDQPETVSDTLGLAALGLPDVECHYTGIDPTVMADVLRRVASEIFAGGGAPALTPLVSGLVDQPLWRWQTRLALTPPVRDVIALDPGPPFAVR